MCRLAGRLANARVVLAMCSAAISACAGVLPDSGPVPGLERGGWQNRYFSYRGKFEYLAGFDLQQLHADTNIDYRSKLNFLADYGVNKVRIWLYPSWFGLPGDKRYPLEGRILYPWRIDESANKFDLDNWDPEFWRRTRQFLEYARKREIMVEISLFSIQGPRSYFGEQGTSYAFNNKNNLQDFGRPTDPDGSFLRGFFDLDYSDNGHSLVGFQKAYIDKALYEFADFDHIYYELVNESPGGQYWISHELPKQWMKHWLKYISERTSQPVTAYVTGGMTLRNGNKDQWTAQDFADVGREYWDESYIDGFNFHLYSNDPGDISMILSPFQLKGSMLICNEGGPYYEIDKSSGYPRFELSLNQDELYGEIRHAWGMMTAGGYYSIYFGPVPQLGDSISRKGAEAMQALRHVVEQIPFQHLRPVRIDGTEYDDLVSQGPGADWQVIVDEGVSYLVYFWGGHSQAAAKLQLPAGDFAYEWWDTREKRAVLKRGTVQVRADEPVEIEPPSAGSWDKRAGVVLTVRAL